MPPREQSPGRSITPPRSEGQASGSSGTRPLITFVDSQDPDSRSAIQRHTAHHSNAQRRDARLRSLRSDRPRLLKWQRRLSAETDNFSFTSPQTSASSASVSPIPGLQAVLPSPANISVNLNDSSHPDVELSAAPPPSSVSEQHPVVDTSVVPDDIFESCKDDPFFIKCHARY